MTAVKLALCPKHGRALQHMQGNSLPLIIQDVIGLVLEMWGKIGHGPTHVAINWGQVS